MEIGRRDNDYIKLYNKGDVLYRVGKYGIEKITIIDVESYPHYVYRDNKGRSYFNHSIVKSCFKTRKEAEAETQKRQNITKKRQMLKEYERKLNKELNIIDHYIVK